MFNPLTHNIMKKIEVEIGYREEYDNGEVRYYFGQSANGECYKDDDAFESGNGVCYIREATFIDAKEAYNLDYVTLEQIEKDGDDAYTRDQIINAAREYFSNDIPEGYPFTEAFLAWVAEICYDMVDWQGVDLILDETDWDSPFFRKGKTPLPWDWKPKKQMTSDEARQAMFDTLGEEDLGDRIYEFAQGLFQGYIAQIEDNVEITDKDEYGSGDEWYDEIQDEFFTCVFDKVRLFLKS